MSNILKITFTEPAQINDTIYFEYYPYAPEDMDTIFGRGLTFKTTRFLYGQCTIGADAEIQAQNFVDAFNLDFNTGLYFVVTREINVVSISIANGKDIINPYINEGGIFATFEIVATNENNIIHIINFTPIQYEVPSFLSKDFLITEDGIVIITEDGKKIKVG